MRHIVVCISYLVRYDYEKVMDSSTVSESAIGRPEGDESGIIEGYLHTKHTYATLLIDNYSETGYVFASFGQSAAEKTKF